VAASSAGRVVRPDLCDAEPVFRVNAFLQALSELTGQMQWNYPFASCYSIIAHV